MQRRWVATMWMLVLAGMVAPATAADKPKADGDAAGLAAVEKTDFAAAKPAKPRKVLIYSHCNGFNHGQAASRRPRSPSRRSARRPGPSSA